MIKPNKLWDENGKINGEAVIPDVGCSPELTITQFDCDEDLKQYSETLLCDGDDAICVMRVEDQLCNSASFDLRVRGSVKVGWRESENDEFEYYKHYSQFPPELYECIQKEEYVENRHINIAESNWISTVVTLENKNGEETYCDAMEYGLDNFIREVPSAEQIKADLLQYAKEYFAEEYRNGNFEKPAITFDTLIKYVENDYAEKNKGDDVYLAGFPSKEINTCIQKDFEKNDIHNIVFFKDAGFVGLAHKEQEIARKENCSIDTLRDDIANIAIGEFVTDGGKTIGKIIESLKKDKKIEKE